MGEWKKIDWEDHPLGDIPDAELARRLGVTRQRVQKAREARGIQPTKSTRKYIQKGIKWDDEPLGEVPDRQLATRHGVSITVVIMARHRRGIPPCTLQQQPGAKRGRPALKIDWDKEPLGEISDRKIANRIGCAPSAVFRARTARGIPPCPQVDRYRQKGIDWDNEPLGEVHDSVLSEKHGVSRHAVYMARKKRGIQMQDHAKKRPGSIDWDNEPLGKEPDKYIALMLGCSVSAVAKAREARDIGPYRSRQQKWIND
jgi:hypothetical protein